MIEIKNLVKSYAKGERAVDDLSLTVRDGEIYGFIGHNGAGKSTTIKALVGILGFESGEIIVNGNSIKKSPIACKKEMAYIPDNPDIYEHLSGEQYINFIADIFGVSTSDRKERIEKYADLFEIKSNLGDLVSSYSHGMKQKLAIITALVHEPKVIVMDEPFVGLDPIASHNLKENLGYNYPPFEVPDEVFAHCKKFANKGKKAEKEWKALFKAYSEKYPELAKEYLAWKNKELPDLKNIDELWQFEKDDASRGYGNTVLNKLAKYIPNLIGGSADLGPANKSTMKSRGDFLPTDKTGSNMHFGIREHAMAAIVNGMYLHGGLIPYCATFAVFSDYMKNAMRMSAIMELPVTYILTHDSIGVGEDGPTHQPIEHLAGLRAMPNLKVYRPCDGRETTAAWIGAVTGKEPSCLFLSRQTLPMLEGTGADAFKGGYVLRNSNKKTPDAILIATGSEVALAVNAKEELIKEGIDVRVVSMPCMEEFEKQSAKYKESVLPSSVRARVAIEAGAPMCWYKYVGLDGKIIGMETFGASAPAKQLFTKFGFTVENVVNTVKEVVKK